MNKEAYIGVDLGTSSIKVIAVNAKGSCISTVKKNLQISRGTDGKAEQNPKTWKIITGKCLRELATRLEQLSYQAAGVSVTGQMDGPVLLDKKGHSIRSVPLWCDTRCIPQCKKIELQIEREQLLDITGHTAVTGYTAPKLMWILDNEPEVIEKSCHLIFPKDYITKLLTGIIATDYSDASNSLLLNIQKGEWDLGIIRELNLATLEYPSIVNGSDIIGHITKKGARWSGLPPGTPVAAGVGDSIAAALGAGIHDSSVLQIVIGTAGNVNGVLKDLVIDHSGRVHTGFYVDNKNWICTGVLQASGASLRWWSRVTGKSLDSLIMEVEGLKHQGVMFAPYLSGERTPYLDSRVRGAFTSLDISTTRGDMTRAVIEGIAFSFRDAIEVFYNIGIKPKSFFITGGGAKSNIVCQTIANAVSLPLQRIMSDITARGVSILAAYAAGLVADWRDIVQIWPLATDLFMANQDASYEEKYKYFKKLYPFLAKQSGLLKT